MTFEKPREIAVHVLLQREQGPHFIEDLLDQELSRTNLAPADRGLLQELTYGVIRWQRTLDWLINRKTGGRHQKPALAILLRLGLYQIFWLDRIPDHAAVHETVEIAKHMGFGPQSGFINAVLRGYLREKNETSKLLENLQRDQPDLALSHPEWLYQRWQARWGGEKTTALMKWNNQPPRTYARVNTLKTDAGKLLEEWRQEKVDYDFFLRDWTGENLVFELKSHPPLTKLATFQQGCFYVQDPGTLLATRELNPKPGESILDLCAAPGGKTTFIAQLMENQGQIVAQDIYPARLQMIRENCSRLGVTCVETLRPPDTIVPELSKQFDRVLLDAPCSNTGVLRRRVDLRWRIRPEEIVRLKNTQLDLLHRASQQLRQGGTLVYSTCSLEPEENGEIVQQFLANHSGFKLENQRELLPFKDGVDGAFVARFIQN